MTVKFRNFSIGVALAAIIFAVPGCSLLAGGATGAGVGYIAGNTTNSPGTAAAVGGLGGAAGGALVGAAVGNPLVGAAAGVIGGAATGYMVKEHQTGE